VPGYAQRQDWHPGQAVPVTLDGTVVVNILVQDLLP
jgi:hypothetical protein